MIPNQLQTPWSKLNPGDIPLNDYPRPQLVREKWMNLNGLWEYALSDRRKDTSTTFPRDTAGEILVPFSVETSLSGVEKALHPDQYLWYRRLFSIPLDWDGMNIHLNFEAVDWKCECFVNGQSVGTHKGGYIPFGYDITEFLEKGENTLVLRVEDPTDKGYQQKGKQALKPRGIYYRATSGIWQTVWLEPVSPMNHIRRIESSCSCDDGTLDITVFGISEGTADISILQVGETIARRQSSCGTACSLQVPSPRYWTPEDPHLYDLQIKLLDDEGHTCDEIHSYSALRKISRLEDSQGFGRVALNDTPVFLHGPLDQGYWPESGMTAPSDEALIFDIQSMKDLGFNMVRKHVKVESRRWYYHADRLGMTVIQDVVSGGRDWAPGSPYFILGGRLNDRSTWWHRRAGRNKPEVRQDFETELSETIELLGNHPSIICWVPFNEAWGQYDALRIADLTAGLDPTRLVDHASGWVDQGGGDFSSLHTYVRKLRPLRKGDARIHMISEYGGYNRQVSGHMWNENKKYGYRSFGTQDQLNQALKQLIEDQLIPLIGKGLSAAVYTQMCDVEIESNGFYTYDRQILKVDGDLLRALNRQIQEEFRIKAAG